MGSFGFLLDFEFYMAVLGFPSGPIGLVAALRFKILDSQPEKSNMGPVWTDFHDFENFQKSCRGFPARYLPCFRPGAPKTILSSFFNGDQKDARRKVMQIRGGITSGSAFFDHFMPI